MASSSTSVVRHSGCEVDTESGLFGLHDQVRQHTLQEGGGPVIADLPAPGSLGPRSPAGVGVNVSVPGDCMDAIDHHLAGGDDLDLELEFTFSAPADDDRSLTIDDARSPRQTHIYFLCRGFGRRGFRGSSQGRFHGFVIIHLSWCLVTPPHTPSHHREPGLAGGVS